MPTSPTSPTSGRSAGGRQVCQSGALGAGGDGAGVGTTISPVVEMPKIEPMVGFSPNEALMPSAAAETNRRTPTTAISLRHHLDLKKFARARADPAKADAIQTYVPLVTAPSPNASIRSKTTQTTSSPTAAPTTTVMSA